MLCSLPILNVQYKVLRNQYAGNKFTFMSVHAETPTFLFSFSFFLKYNCKLASVKRLKVKPSNIFPYPANLHMCSKLYYLASQNRHETLMKLAMHHLIKTCLHIIFRVCIILRATSHTSQEP